MGASVILGLGLSSMCSFLFLHISTANKWWMHVFGIFTLIHLLLFDVLPYSWMLMALLFLLWWQDANVACDSITNLSGLGSWSPEGNDSSPAVSSQAVISRFGLGSDLAGSSGLSNAGRSSFDMDDYLELQCGEDLLFQMLKQRQWMESGTLILCGRAPFWFSLSLLNFFFF